MQNLVEIFQTVHGGTFVSIDTITVVPLTGGKKNSMQGRVTKKVAGSSVMVFQNKRASSYDLMVKRRLLQEGKNPEDFILSPRTWGQRIENLPLIEHNGKFYVEVIFLRPGTVEYFLDGNPIDKSDVEGLNVKQEAEQGGLENKVTIRSYSVDSIIKIKANKEVFEGPFAVNFNI